MSVSDTESWQELQHCGLRNDLNTLSLETEAAAHAVHCSKRECGACSEGTQRKLSRFPIRPLLPTAPLSREPWCIKSFIVIKKMRMGPPANLFYWGVLCPARGEWQTPCWVSLLAIAPKSAINSQISRRRCYIMSADFLYITTVCHPPTT